VKRNDVFGGKNEGKFSRQDTSLKHQRRRRLRTMKAQSNAETPTETETEQKTNQSNKFIPAHMRKTVSRITEAQMKTNGVELSKAATQVQESIAGFLAFEFLRARVKNVPTLKVLNVDPPILTAPMFLSEKECEDIERAMFGIDGGEDDKEESESGSSSGSTSVGQQQKVNGLSSMKKAELVQCCEERGLDTSGTVAVLRDRLKEFNTNANEDDSNEKAPSPSSRSDESRSANTGGDPFRTSNPDALVNASSRPEAVNQLLKRLNYLFPDCVEEFESPSARKENKLWGIEVVAEAYKSSENLRASHAAYEQHEAIEKHYQVRANCKFFLNESSDENGGGEITFPALPGLSVKPEKGMALITFPSTAASLLDPRAATARNAHDNGANTLNSIEVLVRGATPKILTEEEAAVERKLRHEEEKERARLLAIPRSERRKMDNGEEKPKNSRKKTTRD
jgi:hypothetical protein|tara:strand:- start:4121 stop:5479 length:1359 start_codon:yes stop_codon:yes gene_type:complete